MGLVKKILKRRKLLIISCILLVLVITGIIISRNRSAKAGIGPVEQRSAAAFRGELSVTLSGSGAVSPVNRKEIIVVVNGVVTESYLEEGRSFKKDEVILKLDDSDALLNVKKLENALKQKELSMTDAEISNDSLNIKSPISGRVSELNVKEGMYVNKGDKLLTIVDESILQTHLVFENTNISQFRSINKIEIHIPDFMSSVPGKIISMAQEDNDVSVTVFIDNPGALTSELSVWGECAVSSGTMTSEQGTLEFSDQEVIRADAAGKVSNLSVYENSKVVQGKVLMSITDDALPYALESDRLSLEQAQVELKLAREKLDNYTIRAPFDGVAVSVSNIDPGDTVESGKRIAILMDTSKMTFDISIDELDISKVEIGQKVNVTVEALDNKQIEGEVTAIAPEGQSSNGVTSYDVTVTIPGSKKLMSGMNVDAVIQIVNKQDALLVPVEAIHKQGDGYIVWVKGALTGAEGMTGQFGDQGKNRPGASRNRNQNVRGAANNYYSGAVPVKVTVGMHNETFVEIIEGLKEGDIVVLPPLASNSSSGTQQNFMMPGSMGGMPGNMGGMSGSGNVRIIERGTPAIGGSRRGN